MHQEVASSAPLPETLRGLSCLLNRHGEKDALVSFEHGGEDRWTYRRLSDQVERLAHGLAKLHVVAGDRVAICSPNKPEWIVACFAVFRIGAILVPLDTQQTELRHVLADCKPRLIFAASGEAALVREACPRPGTDVVLLEQESGAPERSWKSLLTSMETDFMPVGRHETAVLFYTSGTTGPPKGVPLSHGNLVFQIRTLAEARLIRESDRIILPLPLHHVYPFVVGMLTPLALGLAIVLPSAFTGIHIVESLRRGRATVMIGVPRLYEAMLSGLDTRLAKRGRLTRALAKAALSVSIFLLRRFRWHLGGHLLNSVRKRFAPDLKIVVSGGAALKPETGWLLEALGWRVATGYGLTETSPLLTINPPGNLRFHTAGHPVPGISLRIEPHEAGEADAELGEVMARAPGVFAGYHNLPEMSAEAFSAEGWFRTGDLGFIDDHGDLHLAGRRSSMIVTASGKNVQPDDLEDAYQKHPAIREIAVLQRQDKLVGLIVPRHADAAGQAVGAAVRAAVAEISRGLPTYQRLADFAVTPEAVPRTRLGKPRRHLLAERYEEALRMREEGVSPRRGSMALEEMSGEDRALLDDPSARTTWDWLTARFADHWLSPDSDVGLDLGIDSLEWLNVSLEISERTGVDLSEDAISRVATVRDLLAEVAEGSERQGAFHGSLDDPEALLAPSQRRWLAPPDPVSRAFALGLYWFNRILMHTLFRLRCEGLHRLPARGPYLIAPRHASYLDPVAVAAALDYPTLRRTYWAGAREVVFAGPLRRWLARRVQAVPIDPTGGAASSLAFGAAALKRGMILVWFPEGRRSRDGLLQPFRPGIGILLEHYRVPVVPMVVQGAYAVWPPDHWPRRLTSIGVYIYDPLDPDALDRQGSGDTAAERIVDALHVHFERLVGDA